jgi:hypothetical protein
MVQGIDLSADAAALRHVDDRKSSGVDDVSSGNHVGAPEEHHHVAVAVRGG